MLDRELVILGRLAEAALALAEAMTRQVTQAQDAASGADAPSPVFQGDIALAFSRASRAVRMTVALQARLIGELQALEKDEARAGRMAAFDNEKAREALRRERKARVAPVLTRIIEDETQGDEGVDTGAGAAPDSEGDEGREGEAYERLIREASECLQDDDRFGDVLDRPVSEFIDLVCRDLGLGPDWRRLAEEAWAQDELRSGEVGAPLKHLERPHLGFSSQVLPRAVRFDAFKRSVGPPFSSS